MVFIKRLTLTVVIFLGLIFIISFFLPSKLVLESNVMINSDPAIVFGQVERLKNWKNWSPWASIDPSIFEEEENYTQKGLGEGAEFNWSSNDEKLGSGKLKINHLEKNKMMDYTVDFGMGEVESGFVLNKEGNETHVNWKFSLEFGINPIAKFFGLFMEERIKKDYDKGLANLKRYVEDLPQIVSSKVEKRYIEMPQWFLAIRDTVGPEEMSSIHGKLFADVATYMDSNSITSKLPPIVIYHFWSDSVIDIEAGIMLEENINKSGGNVMLNKIDSGYVVTATHYGDYARLKETYFSINEWMRINRVEVSGPPWEVYVTDPTIEPNPDEWKTEIYFPIKNEI